MRLKFSIVQQYNSVLDFWQNACSYNGQQDRTGRCCDPEVDKYQKTCRELWQKWRSAGSKGKLPIIPPPTVECEKCRYADRTLGVFQGSASLRTISRTVEGTIPVPLKGCKKIWLDNVNQKQLESALNDVDSDIEAFAITGSPNINDLTFLERFPYLKYVYIWWNTKVSELWDITKTPDIEFLRLDAIKNLSDISKLENARKLRYLKIYAGEASIKSLKPLENHPALEFLSLHRMIADPNMRYLINIPNLKYFECQFNLFDIDAYAAFEAKRPEVDTNFWEGISNYENDQSSLVGLVGKRQGLAENSNNAKQKKHKEKYLSIKQKYSTTD